MGADEMGSIFLWWFVVLVLGLTTFPITFITLRYLPDKGYVFSKILALLLMGYFCWIFGYMGFNAPCIFFSFALLAGVSGFLLWTWIKESFFDFFKKNLGLFIVMEFLFLAVFLVAGAYKMRTHDIAGTEKPMDFTFINGILASPSMPPNDPWLSGGSISYYYFGYLIVAILCRVTSVASGEGFNLAVALIWALAAIGAFSLGHALTRRYRYAAFSAACLAFFGNMDYWHRAIQSFSIGDLAKPYYNHAPNPGAETGWTGFWGFLFSPLQHGWDYFQASRIMVVSSDDKMINEFPAFSFFLSDLHPHVMSIPFILLAIALAFNLLKASLPGANVFGGRKSWQVIQWLLFIVAFGGLAFMNIADFPTFLFLLGLCLFLQQWWTGEGDSRGWFFSVVTIGTPLVLGAFFFYAPFYLRYQSQVQGLGLVHDRTDLYYLIVIFGLFFAIIAPVLVGKIFQLNREKSPRSKGKKSEELECVLCGKEGSGKKFCGYCGGDLAVPGFSEIAPLPNEPLKMFVSRLGTWFSSESNSWRGWTTLTVAGLVLIASDLLSVKLGTVVLSLTLILFCLMALASKVESKEMVFSTLLVMIGFLLILGCEVFYVRDLFSGALYRMNSIFKYHYQVWMLFSIAAGPFLKWLLENLWPKWAIWKKSLWAGVAGLAFLGAFMYPVLAFSARMGATANDVITMNGSIFYEHLFPADYQAAEWIKTNIKPVAGKAPVILEAWGGSYAPTIDKSGGRLATLTGYPTLLGWDFHEVQWRGSGDKAVIRGGSPDDTIVRRQGDIDAIYTSADLNQTRDLLKKYGVDYVYVGDVERQKYKDHPENMGKFSQLGMPVWSLSNSVLYKLNP
jgi:YYY domain-containing protein